LTVARLLRPELVDWNSSRLCRFARRKTWGADPRIFFWRLFFARAKKKVTRSAAGRVEAFAKKIVATSKAGTKPLRSHANQRHPAYYL
jgi:hypothetical protein